MSCEKVEKFLKRYTTLIIRLEKIVENLKMLWKTFILLNSD
jgi:hypothetical protein